MFLCDLAEVTTAEGVVTQECLNQHPLHRDPTDTAISPIDTRAGYEGRCVLLVPFNGMITIHVFGCVSRSYHHALILTVVYSGSADVRIDEQNT